MSAAPQHHANQVMVLGDRDRRELRELVDRDPIVNCVLSARLGQVRSLNGATFGGDVLGLRDPDGRLVAAAFHGGNLLPVGGTPAHWDALAYELAQMPRVCTSIVGRAEAVHALWQGVCSAWGPLRLLRHEQPVLVLTRPGTDYPADPRVRAMQPGEVDAYLPAAAAMFSEELGISPYAATPAADYRRRVAAMINQGRAFGIIDDDGQVIFKADIGAVSTHSCQIQGVWVAPERRGLGLGTAALAAVLRHALTLAPAVSLYVNDFNTAARRMYARLGMREVATFSTVLF